MSKRHLFLGMCMGIFCCVASSSFALDLKGVALGASKADVVKTYPAIECRGVENQPHDELCIAPTTFARQEAFLGVALWKGKVEMITITELEPSSAAAVTKALSAKFGAATRYDDALGWRVDGAALVFKVLSHRQTASVVAQSASYTARRKELIATDI